MSYRFACKHCGSRFSLEQQLEDHEKECGTVGKGDQRTPPQNGRGGIPCKYCPETLQTFGQYGRHRWEAHREQVLAVLAERQEQRKRDEAKIDSTLGPRANGKSSGVSARKRVEQHAPHGVAAATCPTCGGPLPEDTAQLVAELAALGIAETQAFEAARIARRVLGGVKD